jgi:pimeloyl-[acyl-carrier protein] synthase
MIPSNKSSLSFDRESFITDPYPIYDSLLQAEEPYWLEHHQGTSAKGIWLFSRYEDAVSIFKAQQGISKNIQVIRAEKYSSPFDFHLLFQDSSRHAHLRQLISEAFSQTAIEQLVPYTQMAISELLNSFSERENCDLIADFAEPLPLYVMSHVIGIPAKDLQQIRAWSIDLSEGFDSIVATPQSLLRQQVAMQAFMEYLEEFVDRPTPNSKANLAGHLIDAYKAGIISRDELLGMLSFLIFAGHETTIHLIGNTLFLLLKQTGEWQRLRSDSSMIPLAIEESLRFESPEQRSSFRITTEPLQIRHSVIDIGQQVGIIIGAANRDPREFEKPNVFDPTRRPNRHLAFGVGIHSCLGKLMARMQTQQALSHMTKRYSEIRLENLQPEWKKNTFFRGLASLQVKFRT